MPRVSWAALCVALAGCYQGVGEAGSSDAADTEAEASEEAGGDTSGGSDGGDTPTACEGACAGASPLQLLRRNQLIGIVRQAFGPAADAVAFNLLPADASNGLFPSNVLPADATRVEAYHGFAERAGSALAQAVACADEACAEEELRRVLPILFKRAPHENEVQAFLGLMTAPEDWDGESWTATHGLAQMLTLALQTPQFLYRVEVGEETDDPRLRRLSGQEVAVRLSLVLWNESPSPQLRARAEDGELDTEEGVAAVVREMLADPRSDAMVVDFFEAYLGIDHFGDHGRYLEGSPVADEYPGLPQVAADMRGEADAFVTHVMRNGGSFRELLAADYSLGSTALADYYGVPTGAAEDDGLFRLELGGQGRAGMLSMGAVLGAHTTVEAYRAAHRGTFVARNVLCIELPPPPADIVIPEIPQDLPPREAFEQMTDAPTCSGCHNIINPLGFVFENLDGGGRYAESYPGFDTPVDARGLLPSGEAVEGVPELGAALAEHAQAQRCMARRWFEYALERAPNAQDEAYVDAAHARLVESDLDLREVIVSVLSSDAGRMRVLQTD